MVGTFLVSFMAVSLLLLIRKLQGQIASPATWGWLLTTLFVVGSVFLIRRWWYLKDGWRLLTAPQSTASGPGRSLQTALLWWAPTVGQLAIGISLTSPAAVRSGLVVWWSAVIAGEVWWWNRLVQSRKQPVGREPAMQNTAPDSVECLDEQEELLLPPDVEQQVAYYRSPQGDARIEGLYRVRFTGKQKIAEVHLAFCPPLQHSPRIDVQWLSGGVNERSVEFQVVQAEPYGGRVDVRRRDATSTDLEVILMITAKPGR
ncbi:MAG: hypothetical protein ACKOUR_05890 [Planctomycetota bacterium]